MSKDQVLFHRPGWRPAVFKITKRNGDGTVDLVPVKEGAKEEFKSVSFDESGEAPNEGTCVPLTDLNRPPAPRKRANPKEARKPRQKKTTAPAAAPSAAKK